MFDTAFNEATLSLGHAVVGMRRLSKLTQPEFAKARGISVETFRRIENYSVNPTIETLDKIANVFELWVGFVSKGIEG